jgi:hypothetical protein
MPKHKESPNIYKDGANESTMLSDEDLIKYHNYQAKATLYPGKTDEEVKTIIYGQ